MVVTAHDISKRFATGDVQALDGVEIRMAGGSVCLVLGENGAGKTTLFNVLAGDLQADSGLFGYGVGEPTKEPPGVRLPIAYVRQEPLSDPRMRVWEHIVLGHEGRIRRAGIIGPAVTRGVLRRNQLFADLDLPLQSRMGALSPGGRYVASVAAGLLNQPKLVILDEPFAPCTPEEAASIRHLIALLKRAEVAVLMASHRIEDALAVADHVTVLRRGTVTLQEDRVSVSSSEIYDAMFPTGAANRTPEVRLPRQEATGAGLKLSAVTIPDASWKPLQLHDLTVAPGERLGIIAKDPLLLRNIEGLLSGFSGATMGTVTVGGRRLRRPSPGKLRRLGVRYLPRQRDDRALALQYSIRDNLRLPLDEESARAALSTVQHEIGLSDLDSAAATLSGGNRSRLVLARETAGSPAVLLLSKPSAGLDSRSVEALSRRLAQVASTGTSVIILSSEPEEVLDLCSVFRIMAHGSLGPVRSTAGVTEATIMRLLAGEEM